MKATIPLSLTIVLLLGVQVWSDEGKDEGKKLVGVYQIVSGERAGQKLATERLKDVTVSIAPNAITTYDKDKKEAYAATYQLDTSRKPWRISMTATVTPVKNGKGTKAEGLIEAKGDTVRLIYALPGGKAPTAFKAESGQQLFVLRKQSK